MLFGHQLHVMKSYLNYIQVSDLKRKETFSPRKTRQIKDGKRAFFFAPLRGSLTVEAALILPVFIFCMVVFLQAGRVMETASRFGTALCETAEQIAVDTYAAEYEEGNTLAVNGLSHAYARGRVLSRSGNTDAVKRTNFLLSSFRKEDEMIELVLTYQMKMPVGGVSIPFFFFRQQGCVRAWTGRNGSGGKGETENTKTDGQKVYVTEHGKVYHKDRNCTHIRLSVRQTDKNSVKEERNRYGEKYHACEKCGRAAGNTIYVTSDGNRYHGLLSCPGLKRTVREVDENDVKDKRPCSKCG